MHVEQWIVIVSLMGGFLFGLAAVLSPVRRLPLGLSAGLLFLLACYEVWMDRWENTVTAPIRLDILAEIPLMIICLTFGMWQILLYRKLKQKL